MKHLCFGLLLCLLLAPMFSAPATADPPEVVFVESFSRYVTLTFFGEERPAIAGQFDLLIDGEEHNGFCIDLYHFISPGFPFPAEIIPVVNEAQWAQMAYILRTYEALDETWAAALQIAMWKLVYGPENLSVAEADVEDLANAMIADSVGKRLLNCLEDVEIGIDLLPDVARENVDVTIQVLQGGLPAAGQAISISVTGGTLSDPVSGTALTDAAGMVTAAVALTNVGGPATVSVEAIGANVHRIDPIDDIQELITFTYGEPCLYRASATYEEVPLGDPRTIGFWKHQAAVATGHSRGYAQVDAATLESYLPLTAFGVTVATLDELYDALWLNAGRGGNKRMTTMADRARQQFFATQLNVAHGELGASTMVDVDYDGVADMTLAEAIALAETAFAKGDAEAAKSIFDSINNM